MGGCYAIILPTLQATTRPWRTALLTLPSKAR